MTKYTWRKGSDNKNFEAGDMSEALKIVEPEFLNLKRIKIDSGVDLTVVWDGVKIFGSIVRDK